MGGAATLWQEMESGPAGCFSIADPHLALPEEKSNPLAVTRPALQLGSSTPRALDHPTADRNVCFQFRTARQPQRSCTPLGCRHPLPRPTLSCVRRSSQVESTVADTRGQCKSPVIGRVRAAAAPRSTPSGYA